MNKHLNCYLLKKHLPLFSSHFGADASTSSVEIIFKIISSHLWFSRWFLMKIVFENSPYLMSWSPFRFSPTRSKRASSPSFLTRSRSLSPSGGEPLYEFGELRFERCVHGINSCCKRGKLACSNKNKTSSTRISQRKTVYYKNKSNIKNVSYTKWHRKINNIK